MNKSIACKNIQIIANPLYFETIDFYPITGILAFFSQF
jgi:hypothetical protein